MTYSQPMDRPAYEVRVRSLFMGVFMWMTAGLLTTAAVAVFTVNTSLFNFYFNPIILISVFLVEIGLVFWLNRNIHKLSTTTAASLFLVYAALNGFTLSIILLAYELGSIGTAFLTTAGVFGTMALLGATTKIDLTGMRSYLLMGLIGLIIASIVNVFLGNNTLDWIISIFGVLLFTALTAYDAQRIQRLADQHDATSNIAVVGALWLYLDFINLFLYILRLLNKRR